MFEQFGPIYRQAASEIQNPTNDTYQRLWRDLSDNFFLRHFDGTDEPFAAAIGAVGAMHFQGGVDLSTNLFPVVGGSGPAGAIAQGDTFVVTVSGTVCGTVMQVGDLIIARVANPAQVCGNWALVEMAGAFVPYVGANATVDLNTQTLIAGLLRLGDPAATSVIELQNNTTGSQLEIKDAGAGFNTITIQLGTTGSLSELHFSGPAWLVDKNLRFDTAAAAQIYTNNGAAGIGINGDNDTGGAKGIFIHGDGNLSLAVGASGSATLVGGTIVVPTTKITATSIVTMTVVNALGVGVAVGIPYEDEASRVAGVSFTINSNDLLGNLVGTDTRRIRWEIIESV